MVVETVTSDLQTLIAILERAGVRFTEESGNPQQHEDRGSRILVEADADGPNSKNLGYSGFVTIFGFTEAGALDWIGAWE